MHILSIAIKSPLYQLFVYSSDVPIAKGCRVVVNFSNREVVGVVWRDAKESEYKLKPILSVLDTKPIFSEQLLWAIEFTSNYYVQPIGEMIFAAMPNALKKPIEALEVDIEQSISKSQDAPVLREEQINAISIIAKYFTQYKGFLLHGITGSGKTEVYLQLAEQVINTGKQVLILVPEIGLTPQMIERFNSRLGVPVVTIHSKMTPKQQLISHQLASTQKCPVVLGTRSAVWTNFSNLGLVIIDEEHDTSFKQNSVPRYNAKHTAFILAKKWNIPIVLGTATPSTEILKSLIDKKITRLTLVKRINELPPKVSIIDTTHESCIISAPLLVRIKAELENNKQVILFINRRGYAPLYYCTSCGAKSKCTNCDKELVYHLDSHTLKCHICGTSYHVNPNCNSCDERTMTMLGHGTQRIEEQLISMFNGIDVIRIDSDANSKKSEFKKQLVRIASKEKCIIIGTQILAKGHDFKHISLVGVLDVDYGLLSYNYRATEELMQLLIQVSGRAGRDANTLQSEVMIQTNYPNNELFGYVKHHNYSLFVKKLLADRQKVQMPPFSHTAIIGANSINAKLAKEYLKNAKIVLDNIDLDVLVSLVREAAIYKQANHYYYEIHIYAEKYTALHSVLQTFLLHQPKRSHKVRFYIDVDPM